MILDLKQDVLRSHDVHEEGVKLVDSLALFTLEEMVEKHYLVDDQLLLQTPIINAKTNTQVGWLLVYWDLSHALDSVASVITKLVIGTVLSLVIAISLIAIMVSKQVVKPLTVLRNLIERLAVVILRVIYKK